MPLSGQLGAVLSNSNHTSAIEALDGKAIRSSCLLFSVYHPGTFGNQMTKKEIVRTISEETGMTQAIVKEIVQKTFDSILQSLAKGERVELRNFGVFDIRKRAARKARNLSTGETVMVPEKNVVAFKPSKEMEKRVARCDEDQRFSESGFIPSSKKDDSNHHD